MWSRIISRLFTSLVVAWASVTATFVALHALPGRIQDILAGDLEYPGLREAIAAEWGLNRTLPEQYLDFLLRIFRGDFGTSYVLRQPVIEVVGSQLLPTVELALTAGVLAVVIAGGIALLTAGRGNFSREVASLVELVFASTPVFWLGILLLMAFSFNLRWVPVSGAEGWKSIVLPSITLALPTAGLLTQVLREAMEKTLDQPFVTTVRARGVGEFIIRWRHVLRHALLPAVTLGGWLIG
ncbi:MAG: ABC transporter permease, partial [Bradyrhizobium sp.]|uniref:ABC transporter permease n=1 Tax=Bradyrhizobium sp. TaxID=376 RepID=UPI003918E477